MYDSLFLFKLTNERGQNLIDNKAVLPSQLLISHNGSRLDSLYLTPFQENNETWVQARLHRDVMEYVLEVKGVKSFDLTFDLTFNKTPCCGTIFEIRDAYLDRNPIPEVKEGWRNIVLP